MGRHRLRSNDDDDEFPTFSDDVNAEEPTRTFERDSGGVQGFEYFGVDTRDEEDN